jgi:thiol:disulfide interchange protein DsbA
MMYCDTIDALLDGHGTARLAHADRQALATHLGGCARCSEIWAAQEALLGEDMGEPPPRLWARVLELTAAARTQPRARRSSWPPFAAAAAAVVVIALALAARSWIAPPEPSAGAAFEPPQPPAMRELVAGRDYEVLVAPAASPPADRIAVTEFFMWPCFHCYTFEAELEAWAERSRSVVALTRVPVVFNAQAELHARAFYTADALGKGDAMHAAFYDEIHVRGNPLASRAALAGFFAAFGVDEARFAEVFDSAAVDARVRQAVALARQYDVVTVPTLAVAGRYSTGPNLAGTATLAVVDELVAEEASQESLRRVLGVNSLRLSAARALEDLLRPADRVEEYSRLLEAAADPAAPAFVDLAIERARAGLTAEQAAEAERRYRAR